MLAVLFLIGLLLFSGWLLLRSDQPAQRDNHGQDTSLDEVVWIKLEQLEGGLRLLGSSGSGKTVLAAAIAFDLWLHHDRACYLFDPTGSLFASWITRFKDDCERRQLSDAQIQALEARIVVCELGAESGYVMRAPQCRVFAGEPMTSAVERVLAWVLAGRPESKGAAIMGWSSLEKILAPFLYLAIANGLALTDLSDLLNNCKAVRWQRRFQFALEHHPHETREAVKFWQEEYSSWDKSTRKQTLTIVESFLKPYRYNPVWRASLGASESDFDDERLIATGSAVFIIGSNQEGEDQRQLLDWHVRRLLAYIRQRGSGHHHPKVGIYIDEISLFYTASEKGMEIWAQLLGEAVQVLKRQYGIHPLCILHQSESQLHPQIAQHLAALGQIIGRPADYESALQLAPQLFDSRPVLKYWEPVLMHIPNRGIEEVHRRPVEFTHHEILAQQAELLLSLDRFKYLCRLSPFQEGGRRGDLEQLDFSPFLGSFPDAAWVAGKRRQYATAAGVLQETVLAVVDARSAEPVVNQAAASATLGADEEPATADPRAEESANHYVPGAAFQRRPA